MYIPYTEHKLSKQMSLSNDCSIRVFYAVCIIRVFLDYLSLGKVHSWNFSCEKISC